MKRKDLIGFCYNLETSGISITLEDSYKKHDTYCTNIKKTCIFYVAEGEGIFIIDNEEYVVKKGDIIEIPKDTEFTYIGKMKLLFISVPAYADEDFINGKLNEM